MKSLRAILIGLLGVGMAVLALGAMAGSAKALQFSYSTGIGLQNLSTSPADVTITFYAADGTTPVNSTITSTITGTGSATFFPLSTLPTGFNGSAVVSSNQPVASVVNVIGSSASTSAFAAYEGGFVGDTTVSIPLLQKANFGFNSWFKVQNAGTADTTVSIAYSDGGTVTATVKAGAAATFDQNLETHSAAAFSAIVTASNSQPVVVTVIQEDPSTLFAYTAFNTGDATATPVMPLVNINNSGFVTGIQLLNAGATTSTVTVGYTPSTDGTACQETQDIGGGQSATFGLFPFSFALPATPPPGYSENCTFGELFVGSAKVLTNTAGSNLTAIANQLLPGVYGESYGSVNPANATDTVVFPLIMDRNFGFFTGFSVVNVGAATTVTCSFSGGVLYSITQALAAGATLSDVQLNKIANGYVGSATCTGASATDKLVGVGNQINVADPGDNFLVYNAINN